MNYNRAIKLCLVLVLLLGLILFLVSRQKVTQNSACCGPNIGLPALLNGEGETKPSGWSAYSSVAQARLEKLNRPFQDFALPYQKIVDDLLSHAQFQPNHADRYLALLQAAPTASVEELLEAADLNLDWASYQTQTHNRFSEDPYYLQENLERYEALATKEAMDDLDEKAYVRHIVAMVNCKADLEHYSQSYPATIQDGKLMLVNKFYALESNYVPTELEEIEVNRALYGSLKREAKLAFDALFEAAEEDGYDLYLTSSYRDYQLQSDLFAEFRLNSSEAEADRFSARPGHSEHQTGYTFDVVSNSSMEGFEWTPEYQWMQKNAHRFGFIERYKKGKEIYTGYMAEAWHYRYVGKEVAQYLQEHDITFDEYYEYFVRRGKAPTTA